MKNYGNLPPGVVSNDIGSETCPDRFAPKTSQRDRDRRLTQFALEELEDLAAELEDSTTLEDLQGFRKNFLYKWFKVTA